MVRFFLFFNLDLFSFQVSRRPTDRSPARSSRPDPASDTGIMIFLGVPLPPRPLHLIRRAKAHTALYSDLDKGGGGGALNLLQIGVVSGSPPSLVSPCLV